MELISVRRAAILFFVQVERINPHRKAKDREIADALVRRYHFLKFPQTFAEFNDTENGVTFAAGDFEGVEIAEFKIFPNGFLVSTGESTDVAERLFSDICVAFNEAGLILSEDMVVAQSYISQIVIKSEIDLLRPSNPIAALIENWFRDKPVGVGGIGVYTKGNTSGLLPVRMERLAEVPVEAMQFWAQAPLKTPHHLAFIEGWETAVKATLSAIG